MSFLKDREIVVSIGNCTSHSRAIDVGVPQGSVLGPLLFLVYVNDLKHYINTGNLISFADDTRVVVSGASPDELEFKISEVCNEMKLWCKMNCLLLNEGKTELQ